MSDWERFYKEFTTEATFEDWLASLVAEAHRRNFLPGSASAEYEDPESRPVLVSVEGKDVLFTVVTLGFDGPGVFTFSADVRIHNEAGWRKVSGVCNPETGRGTIEYEVERH